MTIRIAKAKDYKQLRHLWEAVFPEDSSNYLDFYFQQVTDHNTMILAEENGEVAAMLHMNPYMVSDQGKSVKTYYIVAVATKPEYRRRGIMAAMIDKAKDIAASEGIKVMVLMPADERYYAPFDFYFASYQYNTTIISHLYPNKSEDLAQLSIESLSMKAFCDLIISENYQMGRTMEAIITDKYARQVYQEISSESGIVYSINGAIALVYNQGACDVRKVYIPKELSTPKGYELIAKGLVQLAEGQKLILHEVNRNPIAKCFSYNRSNIYDYRPYMMVCNLDTCKPMLKEVYFDEIV